MYRNYQWGDETMDGGSGRRVKIRSEEATLAIYEVHLGSWKCVARRR